MKTSGYSALYEQPRAAAALIKLLKVMRLTRLFKLLRLVRLKHLMSHFQDQLFLFQPVIALVNQVRVIGQASNSYAQ